MRGAWVLYGGLAALLVLGWLWEEAPVPPSLSPQVVGEGGQVLHIGLAADGRWRLPPSEAAIAKVAPFLLHKEDRAFWWHPGVYPPALVRALWYTLRGHRQGGSTLTMQLARLWRPGSRTPLRKLQEIAWAIGLELRYSKKALLRYYLLSLPVGGNAEGIETAARRYFGKPAERLTPLEVSAILLVAQRPAWHRAFLRGDPAFRQRALAWVRRWVQAGLLSPAELRQAEETPLQPLVHPFPRLPLNALPPQQAPVDTLFLSPSLQAALTKRLEHHLAYWQSCGIRQGAILVVEASTGRVRAYVPSLSYESCALDLIQERRPVGSVLKPFLWTEALEKGLIHSQTPLIDAPRNYEGYVPVNFHRLRYQGLISASEALAASLNAPAVDLLMRVGLSEFGLCMQRLGLPFSREGGAATIVGAAEASLYEIVQAYTALATGGQVVKLRRRPTDPAETWSVWGPGGPWIVSEILRQGEWSYKTGTSARLRDAWCIAWNRRYVVGVWLGNPEAWPSGCLKGALVALPLAQEVVRHLQAAEPPPRPDAVMQVAVCPLTGEAPGPACKHTVNAWGMRDKLVLGSCMHYRRLWVGSTYSYCEACLPLDTLGKGLRLVQLPALPWRLLQQPAAVQALPPHFLGCPALRVEVLSPVPGRVVWLQREGYRIPLQAVAAPLAPLLWGRGNDTIGWQEPSKPLWYSPTTRDTLLRLWVQAGAVRKTIVCRVRFLYHSSSGP
ncbi:MAG: penicillin-binding protein 1C [Bacteroidia bacterium]|nr:MAG: penicillin-binding protein 1C [Bacteroidia bacterium]